MAVGSAMGTAIITRTCLSCLLAAAEERSIRIAIPALARIVRLATSFCRLSIEWVLRSISLATVRGDCPGCRYRCRMRMPVRIIYLTLLIVLCGVSARSVADEKTVEVLAKELAGSDLNVRRDAAYELAKRG